MKRKERCMDDVWPTMQTSRHGRKKLTPLDNPATGPLPAVEEGDDTGRVIIMRIRRRRVDEEEENDGSGTGEDGGGNNGSGGGDGGVGDNAGENDAENNNSGDEDDDAENVYVGKTAHVMCIFYRMLEDVEKNTRTEEKTYYTLGSILTMMLVCIYCIPSSQETQKTYDYMTRMFHYIWVKTRHTEKDVDYTQVGLHELNIKLRQIIDVDSRNKNRTVSYKHVINFTLFLKKIVGNLRPTETIALLKGITHRLMMIGTPVFNADEYNDLYFSRVGEILLPDHVLDESLMTKVINEINTKFSSLITRSMKWTYAGVGNEGAIDFPDTLPVLPARIEAPYHWFDNENFEHIKAVFERLKTVDDYMQHAKHLSLAVLSMFCLVFTPIDEAANTARSTFMQQLTDAHEMAWVVESGNVHEVGRLLDCYTNVISIQLALNANAVPIYIPLEISTDSSPVSDEIRAQSIVKETCFDLLQSAFKRMTDRKDVETVILTTLTIAHMILVLIKDTPMKDEIWYSDIKDGYDIFSSPLCSILPNETLSPILELVHESMFRMCVQMQQMGLKWKSTDPVDTAQAPANVTDNVMDTA